MEQLTALIDIRAGRVTPIAPVTVRAIVLATIPRAHSRCPFVAMLGDPASTPSTTYPLDSNVRLKVWAPRAAWAEDNIAVGDIIIAAGCSVRLPSASAAVRFEHSAAPALVLGARATIRKLNFPPTPAMAMEEAEPNATASPIRPHG